MPKRRTKGDGGRAWCPSTQVHPNSAQNAQINGCGGCITCGHWGPVTKSGALRRHKANA